MKPLRNLLLVREKKDHKEEKTESGICLISGKAANYNFKEDEDIKADVIHKRKFTKKDLNNSLIEASKKRTGNYIEFFPGGEDINYQQLEGNEALKDLVYGRKGNIGIVEEVGPQVMWVKKGDEIMFRKGVKYEAGKDTFFIEEGSVLMGEKSRINPDSVVVKITKESRDNVFKKTLIGEDGSLINIFLPAATDSMDERHSQFFVTCGEVMEVGENVKGINIGDIAILDYTQDNNEDIIIGYDGEDKLIVVSAVSTYHTDINAVEPPNGRRQIVWERGDINELSNVLGVISDGELMAIYPFIFLNHENTLVEKVTQSGIHYSVDQKILEREVLAVSPETTSRSGIKKGDKIIVDDFDIFSCMLGEMKVNCINDIDVLMRGE